VSTAHTATLTLGATGTMVDVWDEYALTIDMTSPGSPWTFAMWRSSARDTTWRTLAREVKLFDRATVAIDGAPQVSGRIETREVSADRSNGASLVISGRDIAAVAMSWDADPAVEIRNMALDDALVRLFDPLGLTVVITPAAEARNVQLHATQGARSAGRQRRRHVVDRAHPRPGEKVWQLADGMCRRAGFMLWSAPRAGGTVGLVVDAPDYEQQATFRFERRLVDSDTNPAATGNILSGGESMSVRDVPTDVTVYGASQRNVGAGTRLKTPLVNDRLIRPAITRGLVLDSIPAQPRHIQSQRARTLEATRAEAERTIAESMEHFRSYRCTVQGHGQTVNGRRLLYAVNTMAHVYDDLCLDTWEEPLDEDMLITRVEFRRSRKAGTTTALTLVPKGSLTVTAAE
jgi:prophage tail gpP-like protein